jgi:diacylglycerol kinase family enzyme
MDEAGDAIADQTSSLEGVIAAGGDGSVAFIAAALLANAAGAGNDAIPLAVLPVGTGNAFAYGIGIASVKRAIYAISQWRSSKIDVMRTSHPRAPIALVSLSAGLEGHFIETFAAQRTRRSRAAAAIISVAESLKRPASRIRAVFDGAEICDQSGTTVNAGVYNFPCFGLGKIMWPDADARDGIGEAVVCRSVPRYLNILARGLRTASRCESRDPQWRRFRSAILESDGPLQADGETLAPASVEVMMMPSALSVITAT